MRLVKWLSFEVMVTETLKALRDGALFLLGADFRGRGSAGGPWLQPRPPGGFSATPEHQGELLR